MLNHFVKKGGQSEMAVLSSYQERTMAKTPAEFVQQYIGKSIDDDGAFGVQCVDAYRVFLRWIGVQPYITRNNYADGYWYYRDADGAYNWFEYITDPDQLQDGDWVMWGRKGNEMPSWSHPLSHIAMYYQKKQFGQNQGSKVFSLIDCIWEDMCGAFRWKGWTSMLNILPGKLIRTTYNDQQIILLPQPAGTKLGLISAKEEDKPYSLSRQLIGDIDDPNIIVYGKMNANYFIMNGAEAGQHLGVRVGFGEEWEIPMQNAYYWFTIRTDGDTDVGLDVQWPYAKGQVTMACSPALINYRRGAIVNYQSPNAAGSKVYPNTQSMLIRTSDLYIFAMCTGSLSPTQCRNWAMASIPNLQDVMFMDSGGSSCLQDGYNVIYATSERRRIANALVFYSSKDVAPEDTDQTDEVAELRKKITALQIENLELKAMIDKAKEALNYEILK